MIGYVQQYGTRMENLIFNYLTLLAYLVIPSSIIVGVHNLLFRLFGALISSNKLTRYAYYGFGMIGVPTHEIAHALAAVLFGHKVRKIRFYGVGRGGLSGHVEHSWNPRSLYQRFGMFWIGIAPLVAAMAITVFILKDTTSVSLALLWNGTHWYEIMALGMITFYCIPSFTDLKNTIRGAIVVALTAPIVVMISPYIGGVSLERIKVIYMDGMVILGLLSLLGWGIFIGLLVIELSVKGALRTAR